MENVICGLPILMLLGLVVGIFVLFIWFHKNFSIPAMKSVIKMGNNSDIRTELAAKNNSSKEVNSLEEIEKLFQMKEKGIITEEDFKMMKDKLLNKS